VPRPANPRKLNATTTDLRSALELELQFELRRQGKLHGPEDPIAIAEDGYLRWRVTITDPEQPAISAVFVIAVREHEVELREWSVEGRGYPVSTAMRGIPLATYARLAGLALVDTLEQGSELRSYEVDAQGRIDHPYTGRRPTPRQRRPRQRQPFDDDLVKKAAEAYRDAIKDGYRNPTERTMAVTGYGRSHTSRILREARRRGYLGPALANRAGEARPPKKKR
jgi:hypothetical protein